MGGVFGDVGQALWGNPTANSSGAYQGAAQVGGAYQKWLMGLLTTPYEKNPVFLAGKGELKDTLGNELAGQEQATSDAATAGGWFDSGQRLAMNQSAERGSTASYAQGLRQLMMSIEQMKASAVLPFLSGASQESTALQQILEQGRQSNDALTTKLMGTVWGSGNTGGLAGMLGF